MFILIAKIIFRYKLDLNYNYHQFSHRRIKINKKIYSIVKEQKGTIDVVGTIRSYITKRKESQTRPNSESN